MSASKYGRYTVKMIDWSYATSANAVRFGFKAGCYTVSTCASLVSVPKALAGFESWVAAVEFAKGLGCHWHPVTLRYHPELGD